jgi:RNA polymerase sigma-70 factor (ECF subfamily)
MAQQPEASEAFREELTALIPKMRAFGRTMCGDAASGDDLAQDSLLKAWTAHGSYRPGTNMKGWVFMIMRNGFYSDKRRSWRRVEMDEARERSLLAVSNPTAALELDEVRRALQRLPEEQREALLLIGAGGFSYEEVAEIAGCAVGTIKSRVSRARDAIALILAEGSFGKDDILPSQAMGAIMAQMKFAEGPRLAA